MIEYIEQIKEQVSLLRKYAYEFGVSDNMETHTLMMQAQKDILDSIEALRAKDKEELAATKHVLEHMRGTLVRISALFTSAGFDRAAQEVEESLALQVSTDALREHDAKVLEELQRDNAELRKYIDRVDDEVEQRGLANAHKNKIIAELQRRVAELEKDAGRYR